MIDILFTIASYIGWQGAFFLAILAMIIIVAVEFLVPKKDDDNTNGNGPSLLT